MSVVSNAWGSSTTPSSLAPGSVTPSAADLRVAPNRLDPETFRSWTTDRQAAYVGAKGMGTPKSVEIGPPDGPRIKASIAENARLDMTSVAVGNGEALDVRPTLPGRKATSAEKNTFASALDPAAFLKWNRADQDAYVRRRVPAGVELTIGNATVGQIAVTIRDDVAIQGSVVFGAGSAGDIPYLQLDGSASGATASGWRNSANTAFPPIDGVTRTLPVAARPTGFYTDPTSFTIATTDDAAQIAEKTALRDKFIELFGGWSSQYQLEFVKNWGADGVFVIPPLPSTDKPVLSAFVSSVDADKLYILVTPGGTTTRQALGNMAKADQTILASRDTLKTTLAAIEADPSVGVKAIGKPAVRDVSLLSSVRYENLPVVTVGIAVQNLIDYIDDKKTTMRAARYVGNLVTEGSGNPQTASDVAAGISYLLFEARTVDKKTVYVWQKFQAVNAPLPNADRAAFTNQLRILQEQLAGTGFVSGGIVEKKLTDLRQRFERAFAFYDVKAPYAETHAMGIPKDTFATVYRDVIDLDDNATVNRGYQIFISQEKQIAQIAEARMQIVRDGGALFARKMDVPELIYRLQSLYSLQIDAETVMETEEVNQQNALVRTYSFMKDMLAQTLQKFGNTGGSDEKYILDRGIDDLASNAGKFTRQQLMALSMFEDKVGLGQRHPLERLGNIVRPDMDMFKTPSPVDDDASSNYDLENQTGTTWNRYYTNIEERVATINQGLQIKMNDVTSLDKQANRHFDLANSALAKMNEMLNSIARAG